MSAKTPPTVYEVAPVQWEHQTPRSLPTPVTTTVYANHLASQNPDEAILVIPGYGEHRWATTNGLRTLANLGVPAVAALLNLEAVPDTPVDIEAYAHRFGHVVAQNLQDRETLPVQTTALGHSMGGGALGLAIDEASELFGDLGFLEPVGHNTIVLPDHFRLARQMIRFGRILTSPHNHPGNLGNYLRGLRDLGGRQLVGDVFSGPGHTPTALRLRRKLGFVSTTDVTPAVIAHANAGNQIVYVLGANDALVPPAEVEESLSIHGGESHPNIRGIATNQGHAYMGWPPGQKHLHIAAAELGLTTTPT